MKEKLSKREGLKVMGYILAGITTLSIPAEVVEASAPKNKLTFTAEIIDPINKSEVKVEGNGVRATYINPKNNENIIAGTEFDGLFESFDRGRTWKKIDLDIRDKYDRYVLRDAIDLADDTALLIFDFTVVLRIPSTKEKGKFEYVDVTPKDNINKYQSGAYVPHTKNIILCGWNMAGGLTKMNYEDIVTKVKSGETNFEQVNVPNLVDSTEGVAGIDGVSFIRFIKYDPRKKRLIAGGWGNQSNKVTREGTGVLVLDAETLKIKKHIYDVVDARGRMPLNSGKIIYCRDKEDKRGKDHEIAVFGAERSVYENVDGEHLRTNSSGFLRIFVDGIEIPMEKVNCDRLDTIGGNDNVTCARGIETMIIKDEEGVGKKYLVISSYSQNITLIELDDILDIALNQNSSIDKLEWIAIKQPIPGENVLNAFHLRIIHSKEGDKILLARINESDTRFKGLAILTPKAKV